MRNLKTTSCGANTGRAATLWKVAAISTMITALGFVANDASDLQGLVAYYPFEGNAKDLSGNVNDGAVHGATLTTDRFGKANSAYQFDGSSSYIEMAKGLPDSASMSFSVWITPPIPGSTQTVLFEGDVTSGFDFALTFDSGAVNDGPRLVFPTKDDMTLRYLFGARDSARWVHVVGVANAIRGRKEVWIDGSLVTSNSFTGSANIGYHYKFQVGRIADGKPARTYFKGKIDDLRIFDRSLSADEIEALRLELRTKPTFVILEHSTSPGLALFFDTAVGKAYTLQTTTDLKTWTDTGKVVGNGAELSISVAVNGPDQLFRLRRD